MKTAVVGMGVPATAALYFSYLLVPITFYIYHSGKVVAQVQIVSYHDYGNSSFIQFF